MLVAVRKRSFAERLLVQVGGWCVAIAALSGVIAGFGSYAALSEARAGGAGPTATTARADPAPDSAFPVPPLASPADWMQQWTARGDLAVFYRALAALPPPPPPAPLVAAAPEAAAPAPAAPAAPPETPARAAAPAAPAAPPPPPAPAAPAPAGLDTSPMDAMSRALFDDTNRRRIANGLPALRANGYLVGIARIRSADMAAHNYFAHTSPVTGDTAFSLMDKHGVPYGWAGENLAKNNYPDGEAVSVADDALWNSPPHRENILNPHYTDAGIALVTDASGMKYFTIVFTGPA